MPGKIGALKRNSYVWAGFSLLITGCLFFFFAFFFIHVAWLAASGISMVILAIICLSLGQTIPRLSPAVCDLLMETGTDNINAIVEELGIKTRAIYLPSSLTDGHPQALIPLHANPALPLITRALGRRLIVRYGSNPDDLGLLISTIGTTAMGMLEVRPNPTTTELETALTALFSGAMGVADRATVSNHNGARLKIELSNPRIESKASRLQQCLGGPLASVAATVAAEAWNRPVIIIEEHNHNGIYFIELEVTE